MVVCIILLIFNVNFVNFVSEVGCIFLVDGLYIDVMDGYFVLNFVMGVFFVELL